MATFIDNPLSIRLMKGCVLLERRRFEQFDAGGSMVDGYSTKSGLIIPVTEEMSGDLQQMTQVYVQNVAPDVDWLKVGMRVFLTEHPNTIEIEDGNRNRFFIARQEALRLAYEVKT